MTNQSFQKLKFQEFIKKSQFFWKLYYQFSISKDCLPPKSINYFQHSSASMERSTANLSFVTSKGNQIWLSSLALAWKQFEEDTKFQVEVPENAQAAKSLIASFRGLECNVNDVDTDSIYYRAGAKAEATIVINKDLDEKFPKIKVQKINKRIKPNQAIFYGAIYKELRLARPFYNIPGKIMHFCRAKVPCYEPMEQDQRKQVFVINYTNQDNFMVRIDLVQKNQMFVLMTKNKLNLDQVFQLVNKSDEEKEPMTNNDIFKIPQINIQVSHSITELNSVRLKFYGQNTKYEINSMEEHVTLSMPGVPQKDNIDELTLTVPDFENPKLKERRMCLRDPFWLILRKKGGRPYFGMFVKKAIEGQ